ncbi:MAG: hypothetical protein E6772_03640 [Dysgonomonas sp.]|nr:hypothetical protein [Dysgonomonas sp.]
MIDLNIDNELIEPSFDRIAKELLTEKALFVNDKIIRFTEIEFYYFHADLHADIYTHAHERNAGEWRFHNQGIDITLQHTEGLSDGGILIRGILIDGKYINGPRKVLTSIFKEFGKVTASTSVVLRNAEKRKYPIIKTFRHLPNKIVNKDYHGKFYRYLIELDSLIIPPKVKEEIRKNSIEL